MDRSRRPNAQKCAIVSIALALRELGTAKQAARIADVSHRTMERWQRGDGQPPCHVLITLMGKSMTFARAVLRQAGLNDLLLDIEAVHLLDRAAQLRAERLAKRDSQHADSAEVVGKPPARDLDLHR